MELIADTQVMSSHSYLDTNQQLNKGEQKWLTTEQIDYCIYTADDMSHCQMLGKVESGLPAKI